MSVAHLDLAVQLLTDQATVDKLDRYLFNQIALSKLSARCGSRPTYVNASGAIIRGAMSHSNLSLTSLSSEVNPPQSYPNLIAIQLTNSDGPIMEQLSLWLSAACPLQQQDKMTFLRSRDTLTRLRLCIEALEETKMKNLTLDSDGND